MGTKLPMPSSDGMVPDPGHDCTKIKETSKITSLKDMSRSAEHILARKDGHTRQNCEREGVPHAPVKEREP